MLFFYRVQYTPYRRHDIESVVKVIIYFQCGFSIPKREQIKEPNKQQNQIKMTKQNEAKRKKEMAKKRAQQMLDFWRHDIYPKLDKCWDDMLKLCRIGIKEEAKKKENEDKTQEESEEEMDVEEKETQFEIINKIEEQLKAYSEYKWSS